MTEKKIVNKWRKEIKNYPPETAKLFSALNLPLPEEKPVKAKKNAWIPAVALTCTAAIAVAVCVPAYLHMQENHGIVGGVTSSAPEEKKELVWGLWSNLFSVPDVVTGPIDEELQKAMDDPANEGKLFRVRVTYWPWLPAADSFVFEGETYQTIVETKWGIRDYVLETYKAGLSECHEKDGLEGVGPIYGDIDEYVERLLQNPDFLALREKFWQYTEKEKKAEEAYVIHENEKQKEYRKALGIKEEAILSGSDYEQETGAFCADMSKEQINALLEYGGKNNYCYRISLAIPSRAEGYDRRIADSLVAMLEYEPQETYFVRVNSVLCKWTGYGNNNYNADLVRELKDEEITQEFGENFLAAIRKRHGIEDAYVPTYGMDIRWISKTQADEVDILEDWYVPGDAPGESHIYGRYNGGFFEAKLTRDEILELAKDPDVRSIYPASSEYRYHYDTSND